MQRKEYEALERLAAHWEHTADYLEADAPNFTGRLGLQMKQRALAYRTCSQDLAVALTTFEIEGGQ